MSVFWTKGGNGLEREKIMAFAEVRCQCGKIVAQQQKRKIYIKCRHCKRFIIIETRVDGAGLEIKYK
jgi:hypothetical protein